jgi:hypothetical protein
MSFQAPIWIHSKKGYNVKINTKKHFIFNNINEMKEVWQNPNTNNDEFKDVIQKIGEQIVEEGKSWFASPIKLETFEKKVQHIFTNEYSKQNYTYGKVYQETWKLKSIWIFSNGFELEWNLIDIQPYEVSTSSIIPSEFLNFTEEFNTIEPFNNRTIVIQSTIDDLLEQDDIPFESSEQDDTFSPRTILKEKIKNAKVKMMLAEMKVSNLEKKYFRLYGELIDSESENSSGEEESSNEE